MSNRPRLEVRRAGAPSAAARVGDPVAGADQRRLSSRGWLFALLAGACIAIAVGYVAWAAMRDEAAGRSAVSGPVATGDNGASIALVAGGGGTVLFQNLVSGDYWKRVGVVPLGGPVWPRSMAPLACMRIHYAANQGLCLAEDGGISTDDGLLSTYAAYIFGPDFQVRHQIALSGYPSRARVSPDGRYGATTVFVAGHSYAEGGFSTETNLIDLASGKRIATLEEFAVWRDGERFQRMDFNFWGVTFTRDSNRFYATVGTRTQTYLVEGDVAARQMRVLRENVECPSLSPDGTRIAFKKHVGTGLGDGSWRFHVLDLATMAETPLAESRSIDDQIEWLDDGRVLYGDRKDIWVVPADGSGQPQRFMSAADSPTVVRTASPPSENATPAGETLTLPPTDLAVTVSAPPRPVRVGEDLTYMVTVTNRGPAEATNLLVEQILPTGVTFGSATTMSLASGSWGCTLPDEGNRVTCDTLSLPSGDSWTIALAVKPTMVGTIRQRVTVYATEPDPHPENDSATSQIAVAAGP